MLSYLNFARNSGYRLSKNGVSMAAISPEILGIDTTLFITLELILPV